MNCLVCKDKMCKSSGKDCIGNRDDIIIEYGKDKNRDIYSHADSLVADGKAGTLSRLDEIVEFCKVEDHKKVGIAYCYGIEDLAYDVMTILTEAGITVTSYRCTLGGVEESMIDDSLKPSVNCNPLGQSAAIASDGVDFVIEMGLCLGHDVLFHQNLNVPFTVFMVKDRVFNHNPAKALPGYRDRNDNFLCTIDDSFQMRNHQWLADKLESGEPPLVVDVRAASVFKEGNISDSINIPLKELPARYAKELQGNRDNEIICICSGSVQSAYAVSFLYSKGFNKVFNLSGGYSTFKDEHPDLIEHWL